MWIAARSTRRTGEDARLSIVGIMMRLQD